jgi:serine/threonine protein kinase
MRAPSAAGPGILQPVVGELIAGRYELEELVGSGGMSSVYRAHDKLLERTVALKILHEQFTRDDAYVERFRREARAVAQLAHPNIVTVIDRGEQDGRQFIVFEYVDGMNLKELLDQEGPLNPSEAIELALQVARGLAFAHENGLVHRDVKPQNVLIDADGRAKVTDFGIAHALDVDGMTITGTIMGSSNYIAPEQARGEPVDEQSDIYSLGCLLYELLTGEVPFDGDNFVAVAMRHVNDPVPTVGEVRRDVPPHLDWTVQRAMAKDNDERFASMVEFAAELEACHAELDGAEGETLVVPPRRPPRPRRARRERRRRSRALPFVLLGVGVAALVGGLAGALLLHDNGGSSNSPPAAAGGSAAIHLTGLRGYDPPPGDGAEHDEAADHATDGNDSTYWFTETYGNQDFGNLKQGVGLLLDAGRAVRLSKLEVTTDSAGGGFVSLIKAGSSASGPFTAISDPQTVSGTTTFSLHEGESQYYVVWITRLGPSDLAHINEVRPSG